MKNREIFYEETLLPKIQELMKICNENEIPTFMAFGIKQDDNGKILMAIDKNNGGKIHPLSAYAIIPEVLDMKTNDNRFSEFVNVVNGFHTVIDNSKEEFDNDLLNVPDFED